MTDILDLRLAETLERVRERTARRTRREARKAAHVRGQLDLLREHVSGDPDGEKLVAWITAEVNRLLSEAYGQ